MKSAASGSTRPAPCGGRLFFLPEGRRAAGETRAQSAFAAGPSSSSDRWYGLQN